MGLQVTDGTAEGIGRKETAQARRVVAGEDVV